MSEPVPAAAGGASVAESPSSRPPLPVRPASLSTSVRPSPPPPVNAHARTASNAAAPSPSSASGAPSNVPGGVGSPTTASTSPSAQPAARRQLQSIRASDLASEHAIWVHACAAEESYWLKQEERFNLVVKRAQTAVTSSRDLLAYLKRSSKLLAGISEQLQNVGSFGAGESGTVRVAAMSIDIVRKTTSSYLAELNTRVFGESVRAAGDLSEEAAKIANTIEQVGNDMLRTLKNQRRLTTEAWHAYYKAGQERVRLESAGSKVKGDPFLLARAYEHELSLLHTAETKFQQVMASLLKDLQTADAKRLTATKALLLDNLTAQKAVLEHAVKFTDNALTTVRAINPDTDLQEFVSAADLYLPPAEGAAATAAAGSTAAPTPDASTSGPSPTAASRATAAAHEQLASETSVISFLAPPPARDLQALNRVYAHEVAKQGDLFRQGGIIKSNWKPMYAVLTTSGFLHLFEDQSRKSAPHSTWQLGDAVVDQAPESVHPHAFAVKIMKTGFSLSGSSTTVYFRAENADEMMEWRHHAQKHSQKPIAPPARVNTPPSEDAPPAAEAKP